MMELTDFQSQLLRGTLLGDGNMRISRPDSHASLRLGHGESQLDYLLYKISSLNPLPHGGVRSTPQESGKFYHQVEFPSQGVFREFYDSYYTGPVTGKTGQRKKVIKAEHVESLSGVGFAFWFGDDGCVHRKQGESDWASIYVSPEYTLEERAICELLNHLFNGVKLDWHDGRMWSFRFSVEATERLASDINGVFERCLPQKVIYPRIPSRRNEMTGIYVRPSGNYGVSLSVKGKRIGFGTFEELSEAIKARNKAWGWHS